MFVVVVPASASAGRFRMLDGSGRPDGPPFDTTDLATTVAELEKRHAPRWVWPSTTDVYPGLLRVGVRVARCHDLALVEAILLGRDGAHDQPRALAAAWARLTGLPVPPDPPPTARDAQPALFEPLPAALPGGADPLDAATTVLGEHVRRLDEAEHPDRLRLLAAAESAGALAGAEMSHHGLPWSESIHEALLVDLVGPRPGVGERPKKLAVLAEQITAAFGGREVNPDNPNSVIRAFGRDGVDVRSTRARELRGIEHPAVKPLLEYKELARLYVAHGWSWLASWVHNGRFHPEYVIGGVVSGRWATRGGAALQLPRTLRAAVRTRPQWTLVVADAAQLEPRVLAALSGDRRLAEMATRGDLYAGLAADSFDGDRARAKAAMLSAMYGGTSGEAGPLLAVLRRQFPDAVGYVEDAARTGEAGGVVRSRLGRTSPTPPAAWRELTASTDPALEHRSRQAARDWGRFTRNFVVQASAADWALVLLATLRRRLATEAPDAELVFFQHDEVLVHCPRPAAEQVCREVAGAAEEATELVFGHTAVHFPLPTHAVDCYADAG